MLQAIFFYCGKIHTGENLQSKPSLAGQVSRTKYIHTGVRLSPTSISRSLCILQNHAPVTLGSPEFTQRDTDLLLPLRLCMLESLSREKTIPFPTCRGRPGKPGSSFMSLHRPIPQPPPANGALFLLGHKHQEGAQLLTRRCFLWVGTPSMTT